MTQAIQQSVLGAGARQTLRVSAVRSRALMVAACSDVVIVADESGSMSEACAGEAATIKIVALRKAANLFCATKSRLDPGGRVALVGFDDTVRVHMQLSGMQDMQAIQNGISQLAARGDTDLDAGIRGAERLLGKSERSGMGYLVVLSDGHANRGGDPVATAARLKQAGVEIFAVGFGTSPSDVDLRLPSIASPEKYMFCSDLSALLAQFQQISIQTSIRRGSHP